MPFRVFRDPAANRYRLTNASAEVVRAVTLTLHGTGLMAVSAPTALSPGESIELHIVAADLARATIVVIRWFRPDGVEYLWRMAF